MVFWLFIFLFLLSFLGFFVHARRGNGTMTFYSFVLCLIWGGLAFWQS